MYSNIFQIEIIMQHWEGGTKEDLEIPNDCIEIFNVLPFQRNFNIYGQSLT